jgi:hypothetical protein
MRSELDVKITLTAGIAVFLIVLTFKGAELSAMADAITTAVSFTAFGRYAFIKWLWKYLPILERFHGVPHIEGAWRGTFESTWVPTPGAPVATGTVDVQISQPDIFRIKIRQKTGESLSHSYGEEFQKLEDGSIFLNFSYHNVPGANVRDRSQISYGSARYHLERNGTAVLSGNYWTDRKSTGKIIITKP